MTAPIAIHVLGTPAPQGSKRAFSGTRKDGSRYTRVIESSHDRVKSWRQAVVDEAVKALCEQERLFAGGALRFPLSGPLDVRIAFFMRRPAGHYGTGRNASVLRPGAPRRPARAPDLSKLLRSTEDALKDAGIIRDDALIVAITAGKFWADSGQPGADITITPLEENS